jgi:hypothetical protein
MDALGKRLVRSWIDAEDAGASAFSEHGLTDVDIYSEARVALAWVREYVEKSGKWPTPSMVQENLAIELPEDADDLNYVCDLVRKRKLAKFLESKLKEAAELLESRDPDTALVLASKIVSEAPDRKNSGLLSYRASGPERVAHYEEVRDSPGLVGVATPWPSLNSAVQCFVNGEFIVVTAMQNTGKTWALCVMADHALKLGKKVLLVSLEMAGDRIQRRLDAIRYKIPFKHIRNATMPEDVEEVWRSRIKEDVDGDGDILVADKQSVSHVHDVLALVKQHKPDIVFIDGGYRFAPKPQGGRGPASQWAGTVEIVTDLQLAAEVSAVPWVVTTQQGDANETGKAKKKGHKMSAWNVRYGKEWVINPDVVIGLYQDEDMRMVKMMDIGVLKMREATGEDSGEFKIKWDHTRMEFEELARDDDTSEDAPVHEVTF